MKSGFAKCVQCLYFETEYCKYYENVVTNKIHNLCNRRTTYRTMFNNYLQIKENKEEYIKLFIK